jgi:hypothetical protein
MVRQAAFFPNQGIKLKIGIVLGKPCMLLKKSHYFNATIYLKIGILLFTGSTST